MGIANGSIGGPVCVLGFGRSGTSLTMRLLNILGVEIGDQQDLLPPLDGDNSHGYWEPRWMIDLNDEILSTLGGTWWRPLPLQGGWERQAELEPLRERARVLLQQKFGSATLWGWKDPRTTLTLPFWKELVADIRYVICLRNPADAISSIQRRPEPDLSIGAWSDLWLEYAARALSETQGHTREFIFYEDYFHHGKKQIDRLASFLGLETISEDRRSRLLEVIHEDMRHHATSLDELAATRSVSPTARTLFLALRAAGIARGCTTADDGQPLEAIGRVAQELWGDRRILNDLRNSSTEEKQAAALLREQLAARDNELESVRGELAISATQYSDALSVLSELETRLKRQHAILESMKSSVSWRITAPLRALKLAYRRLRIAHPDPATPTRDQSLLKGLSVSQVWWFALALTSTIAATDAILTHVVLIALLTSGPFCGMLTGRWTRTAAVGAWALALAVVLGFPDKIWGTSTQFVDLSTVAAAVFLSTSVASLVERRESTKHADSQIG